MKQLKQISDISEPMNIWQVAEFLFGDGSSSFLALEAFKQMKAADWTFLEYDENDQEVWQPPTKDK